MEEPKDAFAKRIVQEWLLPQNSSKSEININAGGIGVAIVAAIALVMFTVNTMQARQIERQDSTIIEMRRQQDDTVKELNRKYDRMQDYLNAIYAQAPYLKPSEKKK